MRRYYISDPQGYIRFTTAGMTALTRIFSHHGIDIHTIRTRREYIRARLKVRPYFLLEKWLREAPEEAATTTLTETSPQHQLLMEAVFGNHSPEEFQRMISKYQKRSIFRVIEGGK